MNSDFTGKPMFVAVLGLLTGLTALAIAISLPGIPEMVSDLATSMSNGQHFVGLFMGGMALGQLPAGLLSDRMGRMPVLYAGIALFIVFGLVAAMSTSMTMMLVARFIQGIGASTGMVLARAIVRDVASGVDAARLMSLLVMILTVVPMLAPVLGAFLAETLGWRSTLYALVVIGILTLALMRSSLKETHSPSLEHRIGRQFWLSVREFFSHRQSIFGVVLIMLTAGGFMVLISGSASLILEIYEYPVKVFGVIFALCGIAMFAGSVINRRLLLRMSPMQVSGIGALLVAAAGAQMLYIFWAGDAGFWWIWGNACLYMFGTGFLMPNAMALALEPVPKIAGMASSIIGTLQGIAQVTSVTIGSVLYDGTIGNIALIMGGAGIAILAVYLLRGAIVGVETGPAAKP